MLPLPVLHAKTAGLPGMLRPGGLRGSAAAAPALLNRFGKLSDFYKNITRSERGGNLKNVRFCAENGFFPLKILFKRRKDS